MKIYSEIQLFGIMLILVVLQTDSKGELGRLFACSQPCVLPATDGPLRRSCAGLATQIVGADGYGIVSVVLVLTIIPVSGYMIVRALKKARDEARELEAAVSRVANPMEGESKD